MNKKDIISFIVVLLVLSALSGLGTWLNFDQRNELGFSSTELAPGK